MALKQYGVLKGKAINKIIGQGSSPHYEVHLIDDTTDYRIAINVKSNLAPSELLYLVIDDFQHPILDNLGHLDMGFTPLKSAPNKMALDFIRGNLFDPKQMRPLPHNVPGPDNDLNEKIDAYVQRAIGDERASIYAFGERWGPEKGKKDKYFGFKPGNGIHDIHMNQGNVGDFVKDDGVWQDGGLLFHFPSIDKVDVGVGAEIWPEQWVAVFLAFQSQCWHTDDQTGHRLPECDDIIPPKIESSVQIIAALVNPEGDDAGHETVTLINLAPGIADLSGWFIADKNKNRSVIGNMVLNPGATGVVKLDGLGAQLGNNGGIITLLNPNGIKYHGVSYTKEQAHSGWTVVF
ncbi:MAG: YukJ family protein [Methylococcaceae bacterium]|nr:YukJ family protein [Methylococcaceae bacterium]